MEINARITSKSGNRIWTYILRRQGERIIETERYHESPLDWHKEYSDDFVGVVFRDFSQP